MLWEGASKDSQKIGKYVRFDAKKKKKSEMHASLSQHVHLCRTFWSSLSIDLSQKERLSGEVSVYDGSVRTGHKVPVTQGKFRKKYISFAIMLALIIASWKLLFALETLTSPELGSLGVKTLRCLWRASCKKQVFWGRWWRLSSPAVCPWQLPGHPLGSGTADPCPLEESERARI